MIRKTIKTILILAEAGPYLAVLITLLLMLINL